MTYNVIVFILTVRLLYNVKCCCPPFCCRCVFVCLILGYLHPLVWRSAISGSWHACRRDLTLHSAMPQTLRRASPSCHTIAHVLCTTPAFCTHPQILFGTLSADSALTLFMCSILMLSNQHATPTSQSQHPLDRFTTMRSPYSRLIVVCHKRGRLFLEPPGRWHKADCKVTPVQRILGKFYRPASVAGVIWTMIHGFAESVNQKRSTAATLCDSGISTSIVRRPAAAAAAAASPHTQT